MSSRQQEKGVDKSAKAAKAKERRMANKQKKQQAANTPRKPKPKPKAKMEGMKREGETLTRHLVNPRPAMRFPTVDAPLTAVASLRRTLALSTPNPGDTSTIWNGGDTILALYGQPGCLAIVGPVLLPASGTGSANAGFQFSVSMASVSGSLTVPDWTLVNSSGSAGSGIAQPTTPWPIAKVTGGSTNYLAATQALQKPIGISMGRPFIMLSGYEQIYVKNSGGIGTNVAAYNFAVHRYTGPKQATVSETITITASSGLIPVGTVLADAAGNSRPTFYCIEFVGLTPTTATSPVSSTQTIRLGIQNPTAGYSWTQLYAPDLDVDASIGEACRRTSCSLTLLNTSAMINRQGTIVAARQAFNAFADYSPSTLSTAAQRYQGESAKGLYTYMEFSNYSEQFATAVNEYGGVQYDLDSEDMVHLIQVSCPSYSTQPNAYALTIDTAIEFKTQSQRYSLGVSRCSHGELIAARRVANMTPWFFESESEDPAKVVSKVLQMWRRGVSTKDFI